MQTLLNEIRTAIRSGSLSNPFHTDDLCQRPIDGGRFLLGDTDFSESHLKTFCANYSVSENRRGYHVRSREEVPIVKTGISTYAVLLKPEDNT